MSPGRARVRWRLPAALIAAGPYLASPAPWAAAGPGDSAAKVARVFAAYDRPDSPGCTVAVIEDGAFVHLRGYGMASLEHGVPLGPRTVFDIGSTSKQFSAAAMVLLAQEGRLSLDDDIRKHVPEVPDYGRPVTIRHLLTHTSGLRDYLGLMALAGWSFEDVSTDADALRIIVRQRELNFEPGAERLYSNSGYFLLSVIVKRATGRTLRQFAAERIFRPLGMADTHFHDDHSEIVPRRATGYSPRDGGGFRIEMSNFEQTGDGSVYTTVEDLRKWDANFYAPRVGGRDLITQLTAPGRLRDGQPLDYALGLAVDRHRGLARVSHGGSWAGYRAELMRFPEQALTVACLCNVSTANPTRLATEVAEIHLGAALAPLREAEARAAGAGVRLTPAELAALAGPYREKASGQVRRVRWEDGTLSVEAFGGTYELAPVESRRFRLVDGPLALDLTFEGDDGSRRMREEGRPRPPTVWEAIEPVNPSPAELAAYVGRYHSAELDTTYSLELKDGRLALSGRRVGGALTPTVRDEFTEGSMVLRFERDGEGRPSGFLLGQGRIRNLRFARSGER
ncbi:MAG TPA: serine hydrolase domain-containing protein [Vicinamibacteria bacterium]|nr:serine hydrolase domain-containing protein [Vicinamibacteria bacterium]